MRRWQALLTIALLLTLVWLGESAAVQGTQTAPPMAAIGSQAPSAITSTVYLPLIAKPAPTIPYVLTKIKLPAGSHPHGIALDPNGQRAFVGNHGTNSLSVINTTAMIVSATIPLPYATGPNGVAYHTATDRVYVANRDSHNLSIVDPTNQVWIANRAVGSMPDGVAAAGDLIYVANFGSNSVSILNAQTNLVSSTLSIGVEPAMFTQLEDSGTVFLSAHGNSTVYFLQHGAYLNSTLGITAPYGLAIDQITHRLYVANRGEARTTTLLDVDPNWNKGTLNVGQEPYVIGVNSRTGHVFVSLGDRVNVYDRRDNALIASLPIGTGAEEGLVVDPERGLIYVTSRDTDEVTVIQDIPTYDLAYLNIYIGYTNAPSVKSNILLMNDTGQHTTTLHLAINRGDDNTDLTWRPDGKRLAYTSYRTHTGEIYAIDPLGDSEVNLTNSQAARDEDPAWSPDGTKIAWNRDNNVWVMNADGSHPVSLTSGLIVWTPQWSPDGQWLSFTGYVSATSRETIYLIPAVGGTPIDLINDPASDNFDAAWSPTGDEIAFESNRDTPISGTYQSEIYKVNVHTLAQIRLTHDGGAGSATWSPDGAHLAFLGAAGLYVMNPDGNNLRSLPMLTGYPRQIAWSPDSRRIAGQSGSGTTDIEIYVIDIVTGDVKRLTNNVVYDSYPVWRPDTWK
jgi:YVTN family beta-propeller protein